MDRKKMNKTELFKECDRRGVGYMSNWTKPMLISRLKEEDEYFPLPQQLRSNIKNISDFLSILNISESNPKSEYRINNDKKWTATEALNSL